MKRNLHMLVKQLWEMVIFCKKSTCNICMNMVNSECCENEMVLCYEVY